MNKLLVITVLVAVLALSAESLRLPRQTDEEGFWTKITGAIKNCYDQTINTASGYVESVRGMKLEEKAKNLYHETSQAVGTYAGIMQDQIYHIFNPQQPYSSIASLGEHDLTVEEATEQHIQVADVIRHSPYRSPLHSLTMVRLAMPARFNQYVQPIPLPTRCPQPGESCGISGWGSTNQSPYEPRRNLKCINAPVVSDQTCIDSLPEYLYWSPGMVCAGRNDTDNCMWDTSSVMECGGQLQGLLWFRQGCSDSANPSIYTKMCSYTAWIKGVMDRYAASTAHPPLGTTTNPRETK